jgi:hypothetical protein
VILAPVRVSLRQCIDPNEGVSRSLAKSMHNKGIVHRRMNEVNASMHEQAAEIL